MTRFTNVPPSLQSRFAAGGAVKTAISRRSGLRKR